MADILLGFNDLASRFADRIEDVGIQRVFNAVQTSLTEFSRQVDAASALFMEDVSSYQFQFDLAAHTRLAPIDIEDGTLRPMRAQGHYDVAYPIDAAGGAFGHSRVEQMYMTVEDAMKETAAMQEAYKRWRRDYILAALFTNANRSYVDRLENHGTLTVMPLANNDTVTYWKRGGQDVEATDNHFLTHTYAGSDISNTNDPYEAAATEIREHDLVNTGEVVHLIPTASVAPTLLLTAFKDMPDMNLTQAQDTEYVRGRLGVSVPGTLWGYHATAKSWIAEWASLPSNYMITLMTGGTRPLGRRQPILPGLRGGLRLVGEITRWPYTSVQYQVREGFGALNRVGAVIDQFNTASPYAAPSGYTTPPAM